VVLEPGQVAARPSDLSWFPDTYTADEQIAYIQFTSGTTGLRKGVQLSHRAILNFVKAWGQALEINPHDVTINWMPLYHDFGLFAGFLVPLIYHIPTVLMSPFKFVRNPGALFQAIDRHKGTLCWVTNAAMHHATGAVRDRTLEGLDLRSLRMYCNGGEAVLQSTMERFLARFTPYGFPEAALLSGYGLAENTMAATVSPPGAQVPVDWVNTVALQTNQQAIPMRPYAEGARPIVSCGVPLPGTDLHIIDDQKRLLSERHVGEIILRTPHLFSGYHRRPDLTEQALSDGWLHTGDLGYWAQGHLYVCGRKKDLIITAGQNIHPEDIEAVAKGLPEIVPHRVVAFGVQDEDLGTEKIVLICDLLRSTPEAEHARIERELRRRVYNDLGIALTEVHLMKKGWVVLTPNGKIPRPANREKYLRLLADQGERHHE